MAKLVDQKRTTEALKQAAYVLILGPIVLLIPFIGPLLARLPTLGPYLGGTVTIALSAIVAGAIGLLIGNLAEAWIRKSM